MSSQIFFSFPSSQLEPRAFLKLNFQHPKLVSFALSVVIILSTKETFSTYIIITIPKSFVDPPITYNDIDICNEFPVLIRSPDCHVEFFKKSDRFAPMHLNDHSYSHGSPLPPPPPTHSWLENCSAMWPKTAQIRPFEKLIVLK